MVLIYVKPQGTVGASGLCATILLHHKKVPSDTRYSISFFPGYEMVNWCADQTLTHLIRHLVILMQGVPFKMVTIGKWHFVRLISLDFYKLHSFV